MDVLSIIIGFSIGLIVVALAVEFGMKKTSENQPSSKRTNSWNISEISNPRIIAEYLSDVDIPKNSKVVVNKYKDKDKLAGLEVKEHKGLKGNFIIGDDRVLILSGPVKKDETGIWTIEKDIVEQLNQEFDELWNEGNSLKFEEK